MKQAGGLENARQRLAELKAAGQKVERLDPIERAKGNPSSLRLAMTATRSKKLSLKSNRWNLRQHQPNNLTPNAGNARISRTGPMSSTTWSVDRVLVENGSG
jgi:hypothetical protein